MESKSLFRTFGIILFSAIVNTLCFIAILGLPMPQIFSSSRDPEAVLQNLKQKEITEPVNPQPLTLNDIPAPTPKRTRVKPKRWKTAHVKPVVKPTAKKLDVPPAEPRSDEETTADKPSEHQPKVVDVNFDNNKKPEETKPEEAKPAEAKVEEAKPDEVKAEEAKPEEAAKEAPKENSQSPEQVKREEMDEAAQQPATADSDKDDKDKLTPVKDRIAGVQAAKDDSETEANSPDANPPQPDEIQPAAVLDSTDGQ